MPTIMPETRGLPLSKGTEHRHGIRENQNNGHSLRIQASLFMTLWKVLSVPRDSTTSAFDSLRMQTSEFMTLWKEMSVPPDSTTSAFDSLRMQTSEFMTLCKEMSVPPDSTTTVFIQFFADANDLKEHIWLTACGTLK